MILYHVVVMLVQPGHILPCTAISSCQSAADLQPLILCLVCFVSQMDFRVIWLCVVFSRKFS